MEVFPVVPFPRSTTLSCRSPGKLSSSESPITATHQENKHRLVGYESSKQDTPTKFQITPMARNAMDPDINIVTKLMKRQRLAGWISSSLLSYCEDISMERVAEDEGRDVSDSNSVVE